MIVTANIWFNRSFSAYKLKKLIPGMARHGLKKVDDILVGEPVMAFVNGGFWRVPCECGGTEFAWEECILMCQSCWNANHKHHYRPSVFPQERKKIEQILEKRPLKNRNWYPYETIKQLQQENEEHKEELL